MSGLRLLGSTRSPFTRKARIAGRVAGIEVELIDTLVSQFRTAFDPVLGAANPLLQIPVLLGGQPDPLPDSGVIAQYFDTISAHPGRLVGEGAARIECLARHAAADNFTAKAVRRAEEMRKAEAARSAPWLAANLASLNRQLDRWNEAAPALPRKADLGAIALIVALDYLAFRLPEVDPFAGRPALAALHAGMMAAEPAFAAIPFSE